MFKLIRSIKQYSRDEVFYFRQVINLLYVIFPGIFCAIIFHNAFYNLSAFFALASVMPYGSSYKNKSISYGMLFFITFFSFLFVIYPEQKFYYWVIILLMSVTFGFLEANIDRLRTLFSWIFIGVLYGIILLNNFSVTENIQDFSLMLVISFFSISLYFLLAKVTYKPYGISICFQSQEVIHYLKYFIYLSLGVAILYFAKLEQPQWFLWSGLSVLSLRLESAKVKIKYRISAGLFGVLLGFGVIQILPIGEYLSVIAYAGILLSLRVFRQYLHSFATRCFFIILLSGNAYFSVGNTRLVDVVVGGILGLLCSILLAYVDEKLTGKKR